MLTKNMLRLFLSALLFENGVYYSAISCAKFRQLEIGDKRFPPLDHGGVASAFLGIYIHFLQNKSHFFLIALNF